MNKLLRRIVKYIQLWLNGFPREWKLAGFIIDYQDEERAEMAKPRHFEEAA
jgi:hypothetical protein